MSYETWKYGETKRISELIVKMIQINPQLAKFEPMEVLPSLLSDSADKPELRRALSDQPSIQTRRTSDVEQLNIAKLNRSEIFRLNFRY